jgi:hypothetical protein
MCFFKLKKYVKTTYVPLIGSGFKDLTNQNHFFWYHPFSNFNQVHALFDDWEDMTVDDWDGTRDATRDKIKADSEYKL